MSVFLVDLGSIGKEQANLRTAMVNVWVDGYHVPEGYITATRQSGRCCSGGFAALHPLGPAVETAAA